MTELILTEKFSVASDFAKALGVKTKKDGFFEGQTHVITWAVGHLVELFEPDDYDPALKKWQAATLPLIPETFKYKPIKRTYKQFQTIKGLLKKGNFDRIIIATDAGREGEVIARTILLESGFKDKGRIVRFWTSQALVPEVVRNTMKCLKPITDYDRLWRAGYYRQVADWLVGMNLTRILTVRLRDLFSVGRVQTAVLALIVDRRKERETFVPETYWNLKVVFKGEKGAWTGLWFKDKRPETEKSPTQANRQEDRQDNRIGTRITDEHTAEDLVSRLKAEKSPGVVLGVKKEKKKEPPPFLFSLTDLQQEANRRFGFPAKKTLALAQTLYQDRKCLSYPRTDSRVLGTTSLDLVNKIMEKFLPVLPDIFSNIDPGRINISNRRVFNDAKLTDHHALIPFKPISQGANRDEHLLFDLVVRRFAAAFHPDCWFESTRVVTQFSKETFQTLGRVILDPGWRRVYTTGFRDKAEAELIPPIVAGDRGTAEKIDLEKKQTTPPPEYSDALLLKDMTNPGSYVEEEEIKKLYRGDIGIGTQSTRAQIIETLISREYVERAGKHLLAKDKGVYLVNELRQCPVACVLTLPEETARWEMSLNTIALGESSDFNFLDNIKTFVAKAVAELKLADLDLKSFANARPESESCVVGICPACGKAVRENSKAFSCEDRACEFVIFKQIAGKRISPRMAANLIQYGKSGPFKGFLSKKKKRFSASLKIVNNQGKWKVEFDFNREDKGAGTNIKTKQDFQGSFPDSRAYDHASLNLSPGSSGKDFLCPLCMGKIIEGNRGFGCSNWRREDGDCRFVIWKKILGKNLTLKNVETLVAGKTTRPYVFKDDRGASFKATLRMVKMEDGFFIEITPKDGHGKGCRVACSR